MIHLRITYSNKECFEEKNLLIIIYLLLLVYGLSKLRMFKMIHYLIKAVSNIDSK